MIIYRDLKHGTRTECPPGMADAVNLTSAEDAKGRLWCAGDALRLAGAPDREWHDIDDGWQVRMTKEGPEPETLAFMRPWALSSPVTDGAGHSWRAPRILNKAGDRIFRVCYGGPQWLPILTGEQSAVEECAKAARAALASDGSAPREAACSWADAFIRIAHPIAPGVMAALGLLDDLLLVESIRVATGEQDG